MKIVLEYLRPYRGKMSLGLTLKALGTMLELFLPYILTHILKNVIVEKNIQSIIYWGGLMIILSLFCCISNSQSHKITAWVSRHFAENLRQDLFCKTLSLSSRQTDRFTIPSLESRITTDTYYIHKFISVMQRMGIRAPIMLIGCAGITLFMDPVLALIMFAILPFVFIIVSFMAKRGIRLYTRVQSAVDTMIRIVREDVVGIKVIKALSKEEYEKKRYEKSNNNLVKKEMSAGLIMGSVSPLMTFIMNFGIAIVVAFSAVRIKGGHSDPETVIAFIQYFTLIAQAMMGVTRLFVMMSKCLASAGRIEEIMNCKEDLATLPQENFPVKNPQNYIEFDNVSFGYTDNKKHLSDISFAIGKGQSLGIIGETGSGKTTLIKLLLRLYDVSSGSVRIEGRDIRTIDKNELTQKFGTVMQNDFLYSETIEENISFGRDLSHEDVKFGAKISQAEEFITEMPEGYNHRLVPKGSNLSGGQKQRLLIARAVAGRPDILILDDSSSALDYKTEAKLRHAVEKELGGTTLITIAQRISAVKSCDLILVMENGKIIARGTHDELMKSSAEYREISESQMGGAFVD